MRRLILVPAVLACTLVFSASASTAEAGLFSGWFGGHGGCCGSYDSCGCGHDYGCGGGYDHGCGCGSYDAGCGCAGG